MKYRDTCAKCGQKISKEMRVARENERRAAIKKSLNERKLQGLNVGRPKWEK